MDKRAWVKVAGPSRRDIILPGSWMKKIYTPGEAEEIKSSQRKQGGIVR